VKKEIIPLPVIAQTIRVVRGQKVLLDGDLAQLYGVLTGHLNRAVKRNFGRFPSDFMFQLTAREAEILKCQIGISSWGGRRALPHAFTEQGVAMLSSVLKSEHAVWVNIEPEPSKREIGFHVREKPPRYRTRKRR
jgi:hypothetical protein